MSINRSISVLHPVYPICYSKPVHKIRPKKQGVYKMIYTFNVLPRGII